MIVSEALTVAFGPTVALRDVSIELAPGAWGLFGPNASGKSTFLRCLAGLQRPIEGRVVRWGNDSVRVSEDVRRRIGWAGHQPGLYPRLTVEENIRLFAGLCNGDQEDVPRLMTDLGLDAKAAVPVIELSAGFLRRTAIARALVHAPDLLLLDEPFANLDDDAAERVVACIVAWHQAREDRVSVVATHGAKRVRSFAQTGIVLKGGSLAAVQDYTS